MLGLLPEHFSTHQEWAELITKIFGALTALGGAAAMIFKPFRHYLRRKGQQLLQLFKDAGAIFVVPREMRKHIKRRPKSGTPAPW